jgi:hypothetical protein
MNAFTSETGGAEVPSRQAASRKTVGERGLRAGGGTV